MEWIAKIQGTEETSGSETKRSTTEVKICKMKKKETEMGRKRVTKTNKKKKNAPRYQDQVDHQ